MIRHHFFIKCLFFSVYSSAIISQQTIDTTGDNILEEVVVTSQFAPTDTRETVNTVKIIDRKVIEMRGVSNLVELLQAEANIRISQDAILGGSISINGIQGENVKILLDGVPVIGRLNGNLNLNQIPLTDIQRIEIVEGAQSLIYGSDASGGVINLITRRSQLNTINATVQSLYENNGYRNLSAMGGYRKNKIFLNFSGQSQHFVPNPDTVGQRDQYWNPKQLYSGRGTLRYMIDDLTEIRITGGITQENIQNLGELRRPQFKPYAFDNYYSTFRDDLNAFFQKGKPNHWLTQGSIRYSGFDRIDNVFRYDVESNERTLLTTGQDTNLSSGWNARWTWATDRKDCIFNYLVGAELNTEAASGSRLFDSTSTNPLRVINYETGLFSNIKFRLSQHLTMQGGARWIVNKNYGSAVIPSFWVAYKPSQKDWTIRSSVALGYRSPSLNELYFSFIDINHYVIGNRNLQPEKSLNVKAELGFTPKKQLGWQISGTFSSFYNRVADRIILASFGPVEFEYRNVEVWKSIGAIASLNLGWNDKILYKTSILRAGYFNTLSKTDDNVPELGWSTDWTNEMNFSISKRLAFNIWHKRTGQTPFFYADKEGVTRQEFLKVWDFVNASVTTRLHKNKLSIQAGVKNITNVKQNNANLGSANHTDTGNQQVLHWGRIFFVGIGFSI